MHVIFDFAIFLNPLIVLIELIQLSDPNEIQKDLLIKPI